MAPGLSDVVKVRVDADTRAELERRAARLERSVGAVIRLAIRDYLAADAHPTRGGSNG